MTAHCFRPLVVGLALAFASSLLFVALIQQSRSSRRASESSVTTENATSTTVIMTVLCVALFLSALSPANQSRSLVSLPVCDLSFCSSYSTKAGIHNAIFFTLNIHSKQKYTVPRQKWTDLKFRSLETKQKEITLTATQGIK